LSAFDDMGKPRVFLGMPSGAPCPDDVAMTWHDPIWCCDPRKTTLIEKRQWRQSSIVGGFNALWGRALDLRDQGKVSHFAMQHADAEPESWWIDTLLGLLRQRNLAAIFTVMAIKYHRAGLSWEEQEVSSGAAKRNDRFDRRRFTWGDLARMPQTFTNQHVPPDEYVLPNTALWVADIRHPIWDDFLFTQDGRFIRGESGERTFELQPEDWELGRWMTERGIPYGCTTAVKCKHHGPDTWPNFDERVSDHARR